MFPTCKCQKNPTKRGNFFITKRCKLLLENLECFLLQEASILLQKEAGITE